MNYSEILNLLEKGFTPEQVMELSKTPAPAEPEKPVDPVEPEKPVDPVEQVTPDKAPAWAEELNQTIKRMTYAVQAQGLMQSQLPEPVHETADDVLASIIAPPARKATK